MPCIFGNDDQWATVNTLDPDLIKKIAAYERGFYVSPESPGTIEKKFGCSCKKTKSDGQEANITCDKCGESKLYDVAKRANLGISYLGEEMSHEERDFVFANADLSKGEHYPRDLTIVKGKWALPRGAGRQSGGPT